MSGGTGRSKCRAAGCKQLVEAKVMLTSPVENVKVPFVGLCSMHAIDWIRHLQSCRGIAGLYPEPFELKPHRRPGEAA